MGRAKARPLTQTLGNIISDRDKILCSQDGEGYTTFVCRHLHENPRQEWHSREPTPDNPWPDAWCAKCDEAFMQTGQWTDENSGCTDIQIICNFCYERRKGQKVCVYDTNP